MSTARAKKERVEDIFLFVPNLIGYGRIVLAAIAFYYMSFNVDAWVLLYLASEFLDAFDGYYARKLNQATSFGAVLDMVTDRCTTLGLLMLLGSLYSNYLLLFQLAAVIDIFSHWMQMYSSLLVGSSHKNVTNPILRLYYNRIILFIFCAGNELFFVAMFLLTESVGPTVLINGYNRGLFEILAVITFPICFVKHLISILQMFYAAKNIATVDVVRRASASE